MKDSLKIAIAGATGYVGLELLKILSKHPRVKVLYLCAQKSIGKNITIFDKELKGRGLPKISNIDQLDKKIAFNPEESSKLELKDLSLIEELKAYLQYIKVEDTDSVITEFQELNVQ